MNKRITYILIFSLLATHHTPIKTGVITNAALILGSAVVTTYLWLQYQEENKNDSESAKSPTKFAEFCLNKGKNAAYSAQDYLQKLNKK